MEPSINEAEERFEPLKRVTPLSKYLAIALFIILPFLGGWIGYNYAPEKVVEVERIVEIKIPKEPQIEEINPDIQTYTSKEYGFSFKYPRGWILEERSEEQYLRDVFVYNPKQPPNEGDKPFDGVIIGLLGNGEVCERKYYEYKDEEIAYWSDEWSPPVMGGINKTKCIEGNEILLEARAVMADKANSGLLDEILDSISVSNAIETTE